MDLEKRGKKSTAGRFIRETASRHQKDKMCPLRIFDPKEKSREHVVPHSLSCAGPCVFILPHRVSDWPRCRGRRFQLAAAGNSAAMFIKITHYQMACYHLCSPCLPACRILHTSPPKPTHAHSIAFCCTVKIQISRLSEYIHDADHIPLIISLFLKGGGGIFFLWSYFLPTLSTSVLKWGF